MGDNHDASTVCDDITRAAHAQLWAQAVSANIKMLIPVTLEFSASNYVKWCTLFEVTITKFALKDYLIISSSSSTPDADWKRRDSTVLS